MAKGQNTGLDLVPFNSKVQRETKELIDALVVMKVNGAGSVREIIEDMLVVYEREHKEEFQQARKFLELKVQTPVSDPAKR